MIYATVINLKRSTSRRERISAPLTDLGIWFNFLNAADGEELDHQDVNGLAPRSRLFFDRSLTAGEVACAVSCLVAIRRLGPFEGNEFTCVLEDDIYRPPDLPLFLDPWTLRSLLPFNVLRLHRHLERWRRPSWATARVGGYAVFAMARPGWGMYGQICNREGMCKITEIDCIRAAIDFALYHDCHVRDLLVLEVCPDVVRHAKADSNIGHRAAPPRGLRTSFWRRRRKLLMAYRFICLWGMCGRTSLERISLSLDVSVLQQITATAHANDV
jgi:GR25 family glycosyltransferase involved in LPS biosynthesis